MNLLHTLLPRARQHPAPLLLAGTLLILGISQAGTAAFAEGTSYGRRPNPERREAMQRQQAEAIAKLSSQQRQAMEQLRFGMPSWGKDQRQQKKGA